MDRCLSMIKAFVLCAGKGERLWPVSEILPKVLLPVGGKACVRHIVEKLLPDFNVTLCVLKKDMDLFTHEFRDADVRYNFEEEPLGTAGQIPKSLLGPDETFLVWYGDCLIDIDVKDFVAFHELHHNDVSLVLTTRAKSEYGQVTRDGARVTSFAEKPFLERSTWTGVGLFNGNTRNKLGPGRDFGSDVIPDLIKANFKVGAYLVDSDYYDIGNIRAYRTVNRLASEGKLFG